MDRRKSPRRAEEVALHYAQVSLDAAALAVSDARFSRAPSAFADFGRALDQLDAAVATYRRADAEAVAARAERQGAPAA